MGVTPKRCPICGDLAPHRRVIYGGMGGSGGKGGVVTVTGGGGSGGSGGVVTVTGAGGTVVGTVTGAGATEVTVGATDVTVEMIDDGAGSAGAGPLEGGWVPVGIAACTLRPPETAGAAPRSRLARAAAVAAFAGRDAVDCACLETSCLGVVSGRPVPVMARTLWKPTAAVIAPPATTAAALSTRSAPIAVPPAATAPPPAPKNEVSVPGSGAVVRTPRASRRSRSRRRARKRSASTA